MHLARRAAAHALGTAGVTIARSLADTFAGIRPSDVARFILAQLSGAAGATALFAWLQPAGPASVDLVFAPSLVSNDVRSQRQHATRP